MQYPHDAAVAGARHAPSRRIAQHIKLARRKGDGKNGLAAVHVWDAARLFRPALENGQGGAPPPLGEDGVAMRDIAAVIGGGLKMPVESIPSEEPSDYFGWRAIDLCGTAGLVLPLPAHVRAMPSRTCWR